MGLTVTPAQVLQQHRLNYPGMLPREIILFREWLKLHEAEYDKIDYNVRIGAGVDPGPGWPDNTRQMAIANTQLRIDAVAWQGNQPTIIEVKDRAGASAAGQLVTYEAVWEKDQMSSLPPKLLLISNRIQPNIAPLLIKAAITLNLVAADFSILRTKPFFPGYKRGRPRP